MAKTKLLLAGIYAASALASPWYRNQKRGEVGGWQDHNGEQPTGGGNGQPYPQGGWGYSSTSGCVASTITETQVPSTVTLSGSTIYLTGHETTVTLPGKTYTSISTIVASSICSSIPIAPVTECSSTVSQTRYITRTAAGYNNTATETSILTAAGTTRTVYQ